MNAPERITAVGVFPDRTHAEYAVGDLYRHGFRAEQIGLLIPDAGPVVEPPAVEPGTWAEEGAAVGAVTGGALGSLLGVTLTGLALPGVGAVLAGGLLAA